VFYCVCVVSCDVMVVCVVCGVVCCGVLRCDGGVCGVMQCDVVLTSEAGVGCLAACGVWCVLLYLCCIVRYDDVAQVSCCVAVCGVVCGVVCVVVCGVVCDAM